ncbi:MAG: glycosyltransferase [Wenzhouxiangella sp.]|nr:glycosyltransferase [Wenzhouxiangella sp.]
MSAPIELRSPLGVITAAALFSALAFGLVVPKIAGGALLLLGAISLIWLTVQRGWTLRGFHASERVLSVAATAYVVIILLAWIWHGLDPAAGQGLGRHARLLLVFPLFLFLRQVQGLAPFWWHGVATGALIAGAHAWWFLLTGQVGEFENRAGGATNPIYFGGVALLMAFMLLPRIGASELAGWQRWLAALAVLGGVSASLLSGSRGAWVAALPLLALYAVVFGRRVNGRWRFGLPLAFVLATLALNLLPQVNMHERLLDVSRELISSLAGQHGPGGVSERLQMWRITTSVVLEQPWLGPGAGAFQSAIAEAVAAGEAQAELLAYRHPHNQFLSAMLYAGIPGLLALLLLFALPLRRFWLLQQSALESTAHLAWGGMAAIGMLAVMAMSESIFERNIGVVWFTLMLGAALALVVSERRRELVQTAPRKASLSVILIVRNEADRVRRCLESVYGWADEIIVLDSGSRDDTVSICREYTQRVEQTDWPGFGIQKQRALDRATGEWVLSLDADEAVDPELRCEIDFTLGRTSPPHQAYRLPWLTHAFGTTLQHGHWARSPLRLFRRECGRFTSAPVHEKVVLDRNCRAGHLQAPLHHYSYRDGDHARAKLSHYARLQAEERFAAGKRCRWAGLAHLRAALNWIDNYLLRAAFLDGRGGWIMSRLTAAYTLEKYRTLARMGGD